jgi:hypothetical protein
VGIVEEWPRGSACLAGSTGPRGPGRADLLEDLDRDQESREEEDDPQELADE